MLEQAARPAGRRSSIGAVAALALIAFSAMLAGCAGNESYKNNPKPPAPLTVAVIVAEDEIAASPNPFGAGPARFIITNQTGTKQIVTLSTDQFDRKVIVDANQTANFKQTVRPGFLGIDASNTAAQGLEIEVGPERESAQQDLNQP